jgi:hypothetical protein
MPNHEYLDRTSIPSAPIFWVKKAHARFADSYRSTLAHSTDGLALAIGETF